MLALDEYLYLERKCGAPTSHGAKRIHNGITFPNLWIDEQIRLHVHGVNDITERNFI